MSVKILVIDDEVLIRNFLKDTLEPIGYYVFTAPNGLEGVEEFKNNPYDLVITDIRMPKMDGHKVLKEIHKISPDTVIIMLTAHGTLHDACKAGKEGAWDYLEKPCDADTVEFKVQNALNHRQLLIDKNELKKSNTVLKEENLDLKAQLSKKFKYDAIIGCSNKIRNIIDTIKLIAKSKVRVLITGESGTGKELVARAIHYNSYRKKEKFIKINCATLPSNLLESELFGHEKGSFTGALAKRIGLFEEANRGTILLDEISEMTPELQAKLLRVLQEEEIKAVGSNIVKKVDVRVISTSNRDLKNEIEKGTFREDLYYRLNVVNIHIPPLRERKEEIVVLLEYFVEKFAKEYKKDITSYSPEFLKTLMEKEWKGNVREFENSIERAIIACSTNSLSIADLNFNMTAKDSPIEGDSNRIEISNDSTINTLKENPKTLSEIEKDVILQTLELFNGKRNEAAKSLGITTRTLRNKLHEYGLMK